MIWLLRGLLFLGTLISGIATHRLRRRKAITKKKRAFIRGLYAFLGAMLIASFLPCDLSLWLDVFYLLAASSAAVKIVIDEIYNK